MSVSGVQDFLVLSLWGNKENIFIDSKDKKTL